MLGTDVEGRTNLGACGPALAHRTPSTATSRTSADRADTPGSCGSRSSSASTPRHATPRPGPGVPRADHLGTSDARWWEVPDLDRLPMQPAVRIRPGDALRRPDLVHLG